MDGDGFHEYEVELDEDIEVDTDLDAWGAAEDGNMENLGLSDGYGSESLSETDLVVSGEDDSFTTDGTFPPSRNAFFVPYSCISQRLGFVLVRTRVLSRVPVRTLPSDICPPIIRLV